MNPTFVNLENYVGIFHKENNCLYEFICKTKKSYYEYILIVENLIS
jgi:hypothetical protein